MIVGPHGADHDIFGDPRHGAHPRAGSAGRPAGVSMGQRGAGGANHHIDAFHRFGDGGGRLFPIHPAGLHLHQQRLGGEVAAHLVEGQSDLAAGRVGNDQNGFMLFDAEAIAGGGQGGFVQWGGHDGSPVL